MDKMIEITDLKSEIWKVHSDQYKNQIIFKFANGYGASVVQGEITYGGDQGLFELAVVTFTEDGKFNLCYDTPITGDVLGYLSPEEVKENLLKIKNL